MAGGGIEGVGLPRQQGYRESGVIETAWLSRGRGY